MPKRIQRKRTKGWKMPENTVSVTRSGLYGNPFKVGGEYKLVDLKAEFLVLHFDKDGMHADGAVNIQSPTQAVEFYREYRRKIPLSSVQIAELRGKDLACFCPLDQPCHADVLLEIANA